MSGGCLSGLRDELSRLWRVAKSRISRRFNPDSCYTVFVLYRDTRLDVNINGMHWCKHLYALKMGTLVFYNSSSM